METTNEIVRKVAEEMLNTSMQDITAEIICGWATRLGDAATCEKSSHVGNEPMTLDEAIAHAEEAVNDTPCGREHKQLADWLKELREIKVGNAAKMRAALNMLLGVFDSGLVEYSDACDHSDTAQIQYVLDKAGEALSAPARNCDRFKSEYDYDKLHEAFVKHCDSCNCPIGCIHRRDTRCMLDTRCGSILKCFAKFVLAEAKGGAK